AYAELVGKLLDGRALDETHLLEVARASGRAAGRVDGLRDAVFEPERLRGNHEVALEAAPALPAAAGERASAASASAASAGASRVGGRNVSGLRRRGLAGRAVE